VARVGAYPGTFDPLHLGHLSIIRRALRLVDRLVVGVATNPSKSPLFTLEERVATVTREAAALDGARPGRVEVVPFRGLAVAFAREHGAGVLVRGLRSGTDLDYEAQMAGMNAAMAPDVETLFLLAEPALSPVASSLVRDVARLGGDASRFVPAAVLDEVAAKLGAAR
jgi:pantetheine-phosphate adenylyltransferase